MTPSPAYIAQAIADGFVECPAGCDGGVIWVELGPMSLSGPCHECGGKGFVAADEGEVE